jgi:hypothetical protein
VLQVSEDDVQLQLADVRKLLGSVQDAVAQSGMAGQAAHVARYRGYWENAIFPIDHPFSAPVQNVLLPDVALEALASVAEYLHKVAPEGVLPDDDELSNLTNSVLELIEEVKSSEELPDEIKHLLVTRLAGVKQAIDRVYVGGPDAVRLATEAVIGTMGVRNAGGTKIGKKIATGLAAVWFAFGVPASVQDALPAWERVLKGELMPPAAQVAEPHAPEPLELPESGDHSAEAP